MSFSMKGLDLSMVRIKRIQNFCSIFTLLVVFGCGHQTTDNTKEVNTSFQIRDEWYRGDPQFQSWEGEERLQTHAFFDVDPNWSKPNSLINYLPLTVKGSNVLYDLDLHSGKLYKAANLCLQDDAWGTFSPKVQGPSFTLGIIPRSTFVHSSATTKEGEVVENFKPIRIAVFHQPNEREIKKDLSLKEFSRAKILGSFYLEECEKYPCRNRSSWKKQLVLVGVNVKNQSKKEIEESDYISFEKLLDTRDWKEAKVFFHSQLGVHRLGKSGTFPRYRISQERSLAETKVLMEKEMRLSTYNEIMGFRNKCRSLYDKTWSDIQKIRYSAEPREGLKNFSINLFKEGVSDEYNRCLAYVRPGNINVEPKRFWFFQFLRAAVLLEEAGFYYDCSQKTWYPNPKDADSKFLYSTERELKRCRSREAELIYEKSIIGLGLMENQVGSSYRFTEYDTQSGGSHQKIYSWIPDGTKRLDCASPGKIALEDSFPEDINWEEFPEGKQEGIR